MVTSETMKTMELSTVTLPSRTTPWLGGLILMPDLSDAQVDREFMQLTRQFNRRVDTGRPKRRPNVMTAVAVIVAVEILLTLAIKFL